jgi:tRNA 2-selenouridine synthase
MFFSSIMPNKVEKIEPFLELFRSGLNVIDVRTPDEFKSGHIPGAINVPLFNNEERAVVGTLYKQKGKNPAILQGLDFVGPKMKNMADSIMEYVVDNKVLIHCWRGGMRSSSVAWLMNILGIDTVTLFKGYKSFRRFVLNTFELPYQVVILGGKTGSAKTDILKKLKESGEQIVDLEHHAMHKGSAFGEVEIKQDTTQEMFENSTAMELRQADLTSPVWLEDESRLIGRVIIPESFWENMRSSKVFFLEVPLADRVKYLTKNYGKPENLAQIKDAIFNIKKRLGDQRFQASIYAMESGNIEEAVRISLEYYDRAYEYGLSKRDPGAIKKLKFNSLNISEIVESLKSELLCQK